MTSSYPVVRIAMLVVSAVVLAGCRGSSGTPDPTSTPSTPVEPSPPSPSETVSPSPVPAEGADVENSFPGEAEGERVALVVSDIDPSLLRFIGPCDLHEHDGQGAYATQCKKDPSFVWIHVALQRAGVGRIPFDRNSFVLIDVRGRKYHPQDTSRLVFKDAHIEFASRGWFANFEWVDGWLLFEVSRRHLEVATLTYEDRNQDVSIVFDGTHTVERV